MTALAVLALAIYSFLLGHSHAVALPRLLHSPQQIVDKWIARQPGGAVAAAIVSPSQTDYFFGGKLSPSNPELPNDQTIFEIGSITKGFTGLLLADQVIQGNVFLNDTLINLLTDWPGRFRSEVGNLTLLELTTHSSGLSRMAENDDENPFVAYTKKQLYTWLDKAKPFQRGSFSYSNAGVAILGEALAVHAGKPYEKLVKERILFPLGLRDATITLNSEQKRRFAPGHGHDGWPVRNYPFEVLAPAGAMKFSIAEFVNFLEFTIELKDHGKHMDDVLELATRFWGTTTLLPDNTIGLGWLRLLMPEDQLLIWHLGSTTGYNAFVGWIPEQQIGVAVLASLNVPTNNTVYALAMDLLKLGSIGSVVPIL